MTARRHIHPFPARMAPDVALDKIESLTKPGSVVLDPMCGSGTVPRLATLENRKAVACDVDPLAVMITRTACKPGWSNGLGERAKTVVSAAHRLGSALPDWIAGDDESRRFVEYWFASRQRHALSRISRVLASRPTTDDPLRVALSRLIITKEVAASLARDTAHSRPHRVQLQNDFDVDEAFVASAQKLEALVGEMEVDYRPNIRSADARTLGFLAPGSVDLVVTSPPYLNAIDYLRGHRMSLVWFGHRLSELRDLRAEAIGAERGLSRARRALEQVATEAIPRMMELSSRDQKMVLRFAHDLQRVYRSLGRVTRVGGHVVVVVADSQLHGVLVSNSALCRVVAGRNGFVLKEGVLRPLPAHHRYLPPPTVGSSTLTGRMREEVVLTFERVVG